MNLIRRIINKRTASKNAENGKTSSVNFKLEVDDLVVGHLSFNDGIWSFSYSEQFRNQQHSYRRITGFSDLNKTYKSEELWPFFKIRIPGIKQPKVREILESEKIDSSSDIDLLKRFGRQTISNPYILELA